MSVTPNQLAAFQDAIARLTRAIGPQAPAGPGQPLPALPNYGVNLFTNQGPTGGAAVLSDDNHICVRGDHNAMIIYAVAAPDAISPGSAPLATIQILDSPSARGATYTNVVDPQGTLSAIVVTTKVQVSSVQPYVKARITVTHGLWTVIACPVPATSTSTVNVPGTINLAQVGGSAIAIGQALMAASLPVVLASDQSLPLPSGAATEATLAAESAKLPATLGQKAMAASLAVTLASDQTALQVVGNVAALGADAGNPIMVAGVYLAAGVAPADGQRVRLLVDSQGNLRVNPGALASGTDSVTAVPQRPTTATSSRPSAVTANATILALNASRWGATIYNEGPSALYTKLGATASVTSYWTIIPALAYAEVPFGYTGQIDAIVASGSAQPEVTEFVA